MRILVLDTETSGVEPTKDSVIEIAGVLFDSALGSVVSAYSTLLHAPANGAESVNKIPPAALRDPIAMDRATALSTLVFLIEQADVIVAHNAEFDRPFTVATLASELGGELPDSLKKPWVCSMTQIRFPAYGGEFPGRTWRRLAYVAADHGVPIPGLHRALPDALLLTQLLLLVDDLDGQIARGVGERAVYAVYPPAPEDRPTNYGFSWKPERRRWERLLNEREAGELPFHAERVE